MSMMKDSLEGDAVQAFQSPAPCLGGAVGAGGLLDTFPPSINQHKLPYKVEYGISGLSCLEAMMLAAALDAAARITSPKEGKNAWGIFQPSGQGNCGEMTVQLGRNARRPLVGWPDAARITYGLYDWDYYLIARLEVRMALSPGRPCLHIVGVRRSFSKLLGPFLGLMLNHGIAPDRAHPAVLRRFYGLGGVVDESNEKHRAAASAALMRNHAIHCFFRPTLTAAML